MAWVQTNSGNLITGLTLSISPSGFAGTVNLNSFTQLRSFVATGLGLEGMNISGIASSSLVMTNFDVRNNNMTGSLPRITGNISTNSTIRNYYCMSNLFTGNVPRLSAFPNMQNFRCNNNNLNGIIEWVPSTAITNTQLSYFDCSFNSLTGYLPPSLIRLSGMVNFFVNNNLFTGYIPIMPSGGTNPPRLATVYLHNNNLVGPIPDLSRCRNLVNFNCFNNKITGTIPDLTSNTGLQEFQCYQNQLSGSIPNIITGITGLQTFRCHYNNLTGAIPYLANNTALTSFYCSNNLGVNSFSYTGQLQSIKMPPLLKNFQAENCSLPNTELGNILLAFVNGGATNGYISLGGTNGNTLGYESYISTLRSRGWTVNVN